MAAENTIRFVFGGKVVEAAGIDPNMTVLTWLRTRAAKPGTKEGCAEGDCGACTVVLGELKDDKVSYRAVNACILFMPVLDGKQLIVVEDLKQADGGLHPVQQAMVDHHGSQCGFCTPGFVMSMFAMYRSEGRPDKARVNDVIAGNLCRCTGYRPIVDAALASYDGGRSDQFSRRERQTVKLLRNIARTETLELEGVGRRYFAPATENDLADLVKAHPDACILAGGTDVGIWVTKHHQDLNTVIYLGGVADLSYVRETDRYLEIGAATTYTQAFDAVATHYPDFGELFRRLGSVQIRNAGTIGGNVANGSPIGDSMPGLIALGATLVLRRGKRTRTLPLDQFYPGYRQTALQKGEYLSAVRVPLPRAGRHFHTYKISKRFDQDISAVCAAYCLDIAGGQVKQARVAYGGMAATPARAANCEAALTGMAWSEDIIPAAKRALAKDFNPMDDMRATARYRMAVAQNLLQRLYLDIEEAAGAPTALLREATA
jgi:xanthine dehydrogenase small subunit